MRAMIIKDTTTHDTTGIIVNTVVLVPKGSYLLVQLNDCLRSTNRCTSDVYICNPEDESRNISKLMRVGSSAPTDTVCRFIWTDAEGVEYSGTGIFTADELEFI